jgi:hypothetical protein
LLLFLINLINVQWYNPLSIQSASNTLDDDGLVDRFLRQHYLHWLEALSLIRRLSTGVVMIAKLERWLQVSFSTLFVTVARKYTNLGRPMEVVPVYMLLCMIQSCSPYITYQ